MSTIEHRGDPGDQRFVVRGGGEPVRVVAAVADDPGELLAALNARAGEILLGQKIVAATTSQLMNAIKLAEAELGFTYEDVQRRLRGAPVVAADEAPEELDSDELAARADAHIASLKLGRAYTQAEYLAAVDHVRGVRA